MEYTQYIVYKIEPILGDEAIRKEDSLKVTLKKSPSNLVTFLHFKIIFI